MAFADEFRQWFATACFTVGKDYFGLSWGEVAEPLKQTGLAGVCAEAVECVDARVHFHGFPENPYGFGSIDELATQGTLRLVTDDHDHSISLRQAMP